MQATLTRDECALVQATFAQISPMADRVAAMFYDRLFELDPTLAPLFQSDIAVQGTKFMEKLAVAVKGLEDLDSISALVRALGRRHVGYGVKRENYETVGEAWLWALEQELGPAFRPDVRAAWATAYKILSNVMIEAAGERSGT
jgi:hemoglobin-like flavoprotein